MAGVKLTVEVDTRIFDREMREYAKQAPFAQSLALNRTAKDAVADLRKAVKGDLTIRGNQWVPKGLQMRASNKKNLEARVGSVDDFMVKQIEGGMKKSKGGGKLAVPLIGKGRGRPRKRAITPPDKWPSGLAANDPDVFIGTAGRKRSVKPGKKYKAKKRYFQGDGNGRVGGGTYAVWRRMPKRKLRMVYRFDEKIEIKDRFEMGKYVRESVDRNYIKHVEAAIKYAIKTAR